MFRSVQIGRREKIMNEYHKYGQEMPVKIPINLYKEHKRLYKRKAIKYETTVA
jgi:hypothetical protein